jgi:cytochrome c oxidase subunit 4
VPQGTISARIYVIVCVTLIVLTVLTVGLSFFHLGGVGHLVAGLTIAACKATLVILFFMHVLISSRVTWIVVMVSFFWLGILLVLTLGDYFSRNLVPFTPGH